MDTKNIITISSLKLNFINVNGVQVWTNLNDISSQTRLLIYQNIGEIISHTLTKNNISLKLEIEVKGNKLIVK